MTSRGPALLALCLVSVVWAYTWILYKYALLDSGPFSFGAARTLLAAVCLLLVLRLSGRSLVPRRVPELCLLGLFQTTGFVGLMTWALVEGAAGRTAFVVFTMPFWTLVMAWPLLGERIRGLQWLSVLLAALGLCAILQPWRPSGTLASQIMALGAGACWAVSSILVKRLQRRAAMDVLSMTGWQMLFGALPLVSAAGFASEQPIVWSHRFTAILLATAIFSTAMCWLLWVYILKHVCAGIASMSTLAIPIIVIVLSALQLGERPDAAEMTGMGLIAVALLVLSYQALREYDRLAVPIEWE